MNNKGKLLNKLPVSWLAISINSLIISLVLAINFNANATGVNQFNFDATKRIEAIIGEAGVNRLQIQCGELMEVVGDENKYSLHWSTDYRNLFITPKVPVGEIIDVSLLLAGGMAQDIRFIIGDCSAQTIIINLSKGNDHQPVNSNLSANNQLANQGQINDIAEMMRAMIKGEQGKYYVINGKRVIVDDQQQQILQVQSYRYQELIGAVLEVKNRAKQPLELTESLFRDIFKGVIALNIRGSLLPAGGKTRVILISKGKSDE